MRLCDEKGQRSDLRNFILKEYEEILDKCTVFRGCLPDPAEDITDTRGKGRSTLKRPASTKSSTWNKIAYTRDKAKDRIRMDRTSWKRSLPELLHTTENDLIHKLREDRLLPCWKGHVCPRCEKGTLSTLVPHPSSGALNCSARGCWAYISPHHLHPLFVDGRGASSTSLFTQSAILLLKLNNVFHPIIHWLLGVNHKVIEEWETRLCDLRMKWVEAKEIVFGAGKPWSDVEADEATFDRKDLATAPDPSEYVLWEQWTPRLLCSIV
ncbi:Uncharacterized protein SCF082_LOCUS10608 [Durusdinium trenchii]